MVYGFFRGFPGNNGKRLAIKKFAGKCRNARFRQSPEAFWDSCVSIPSHEIAHLQFGFILTATSFISNLARSTAAEVNFRIDTVYGLLTEGQSRGQIVQFCASQWKIDNRQADNYIKRARIRLEQDADMARPAWLAEALGRLRTYEQSAYKKGQTQAALNAVQLQAKLIGFDI